MWIQIVLIIVLCMVIAYSVYQKRQTYRKIDRLLDSVLSQETIVYSDVKEGEFSALVSRSNRSRKCLAAMFKMRKQKKNR